MKVSLPNFENQNLNNLTKNEINETNKNNILDNIKKSKREIIKSKKRLIREKIDAEIQQNNGYKSLSESSKSSSSVNSHEFSDGSQSDLDVNEKEAEKCKTMDDIYKLMEAKRIKKDAGEDSHDGK